MRKLLNLLGRAVKLITKTVIVTGVIASLAVAPFTSPVISTDSNVQANTCATTLDVAIDDLYYKPKDLYEILDQSFTTKEPCDNLVAPGFRCVKGTGSRNISYREWWSLSSTVRKSFYSLRGKLNVTDNTRRSRSLEIAAALPVLFMNLSWSVPCLALVNLVIVFIRMAATSVYYALIATVMFAKGLFSPLTLCVALALLQGCGDNTEIVYADATSLVAAIAASSVFTNLGKLVTDVKRKKKNIPKTKITIVKGSENDPKISMKSATTDCLGLDQFGHHLGLDPLAEDDLIFLEANGVPQNQIKKVVKDLVADGYRPIGARTYIRVSKKDKQYNTVGAQYLFAMSAIFGTLTNLRSYGSMMNAPALNPFEVGEGLTTTREDGTKKEVLFVSGSAAKLNKMFNGIEGGIPVSEKAAEAVFGDKLPSQPRIIFRWIEEKVGALQKGKISLLSARLFLQSDNTYVAKCRADFGEDESGKKEWREGYDFWLVEDDTPKGKAADKLKTKDIKLVDPKEVSISGWRLSKAPLRSGSSLVSYQVLALLAKDAGFDELAQEINKLLQKSITRDVEKVKRDLDQLLVSAPTELKNYFATQAPGSAKAARRNYLGFGAKTITGYIDMNTAFDQGYVVTGNEFGPGWAKILKRFSKKLYTLLTIAGGKNPILDHNQTFVGKNVYLAQIFNAIEEYKKADEINRQNQNNAAMVTVTISQECQAFLDGFMQSIPEEDRFNNLKWIAAYAPALTRGSILMNAEDVALLAGDDDGDQLWFSFNPLFISIFTRIKKQNAGGNAYKIEIDKRCQLKNDFGPLSISVLVEEKDADQLWAICEYMIAPNKGQGPVGYLANLCTVLIATFVKKAVGTSGLMAYENKFVELLQAVLNLMSQTSIDLQKRMYGAIDPTRWSTADISFSTVGNRGLIPGYDFPILNFNFNKSGFDPNDYTKEDYKSRLTPRSVPSVMNCWTGRKMKFLTENDSMYNIGALGSWLVLEILSLIVTGKPFCWEDGETSIEGKGGLSQRQMSKYLLVEDGANIEGLIADQKLDAVKADLVRKIWVEKPSQLYRWKKSNKNKESDSNVPMPPALRLNWNIAHKIKSSFSDSKYVPKIDFKSLENVLKGSFELPHRNPAKSLTIFMDMLLDRFYQEAAIEQEKKTASDRFQNAEERSGVESLRLILSALDELIKDKLTLGFSPKKAQGLLDILNPRKKTKNQTKKLVAVAWMFAWYSIENSKLWKFKEVKKALPKSGKSLLDTLVETFPSVSKDDLEACVNGKSSSVKADEAFDTYLREQLSDKALMRLEARSTWFIDEGISALNAVLSQNDIITEKRYMLVQVGKLIKWYKSNRKGASEIDVVANVILHGFNRGNIGTDDRPSWIRSINDDLKAMLEVAEKTYGNLEKRKEKIEEERSTLKKEAKAPTATKDFKKDAKKKFNQLKKESYLVNQALAIKTLLAKTKSCTKNNQCEILLMWLDPKVNPLSKKFAYLLRDSITPLINVERAYVYGKGKKGWDLILGTSKTIQTEDGNKDLFYGFSRIDFELSDELEGDLSRIFINSGTSFYKLCTIPGTTSKTWRYIDSLISKMENISNWSLKRGFGHLVSLAKPTKESRERLNHVGFLEADIAKVSSAMVSDTSKKSTYLSNAKAELNRIEKLKDNPLVAAWGQGLLVPVTWGLEVANYVGDRTQGKLNGRALKAIEFLNQYNAKFVYQGCYEMLSPVGGKGVKGKLVKDTDGKNLRFNSLEEANTYGISEYGKQFTPSKHINRFQLCDEGDVIIVGMGGQDIGQTNGEAIKAAAPYNTYFNHPAFREESGGPDNFHDMPVGKLGSSSKYTYTQWVDQIAKWAPKAQANHLLLGLLFYKSHMGRISMLMNKDRGGKYREAMTKRLMRCASRDAKLHIEVLLKSSSNATVVFPELTPKAIESLIDHVTSLDWDED